MKSLLLKVTIDITVSYQKGKSRMRQNKWIFSFLSFIVLVILFIPFIYSPVLLKITEYYFSSKGLNLLHLEKIEIRKNEIHFKGLSFEIPAKNMQMEIPLGTLFLDSWWNHTIRGIVVDSPLIHLAPAEEGNKTEIVSQVKYFMSSIRDYSVFEIQNAKIIKKSFGTLTVTANKTPQHHLMMDISHDLLSHLTGDLSQNQQGLHLQASSPFFSYTAYNTTVSAEKIAIDFQEKGITYSLTMNAHLQKLSHQTSTKEGIKLKSPLNLALSLFHDPHNLEKGKYTFSLTNPSSPHPKPLLQIQSTYNAHHPAIEMRIHSQIFSLQDLINGDELLRKYNLPLFLKFPLFQLEGTIHFPLNQDFSLPQEIRKLTPSGGLTASFFADPHDLKDLRRSLAFSSPSSPLTPFLKIQSVYQESQHAIDMHIHSQKFSLFTLINGDELVKKFNPLVHIKSASVQMDGAVHLPFTPLTFQPNWQKIDLSSFALHLSNLYGSYDQMTLENGATTLRFLKPPRHYQTPPLQFTFDTLTLHKIPLKNGHSSYQLSFPQGKEITPLLSDVDFSLFDGRIHLDRFVFTSNTPFQHGCDFYSSFQQLNLEPLVRSLDIPSLRITGLLSGNIHTSWSPHDGFVLLQGKAGIESPGGSIYYDTPNLPGFSEAKLVLEALKDFRYKELTIHVEPTNLQKRKSQAFINISGFSSNVLNGYPFQINIKTTGRLQDLVQHGLWEIGK